MRFKIPEKLKDRLVIIISFIVILLIIGAAIYFLPLLEKSVPPSRTEWAYKVLQIKDLNSDGLNGEGVVIGLIDTGIDLTHPELKQVEVVAWRDLINRELEPYDDDGHGTAMAGILCGKTYGVARKASLIVVKAIDAHSGGTDTNLVNAIRFCVQQGADIISMSLGRWEMRLEDLTSPWQDSQIEDACQYATDAGVFLVAAAGNDGGENDDGEVSVPGVYDYAITVGAVSKDLKIASFSSEGNNNGKLPNIIINWDPWERQDPNKKPECVAPGVKIVAPGLEHKYYEYDGTSMAVPFVTAGLALILGEFPQYQQEENSGADTITEIKDKLMSTSKRLDSQEAPHDDTYGYGLFQAYDLYRACES
jgi:subtilisin family serine protease